MTLKPRHCPPSKQCGCHLISAFFRKNLPSQESNPGQLGYKGQMLPLCYAAPPAQNQMILSWKCLKIRRSRKAVWCWRIGWLTNFSWRVMGSYLTQLKSYGDISFYIIHSVPMYVQLTKRFWNNSLLPLVPRTPTECDLVLPSPKPALTNLTSLNHTQPNLTVPNVS